MNDASPASIGRSAPASPPTRLVHRLLDAFATPREVFEELKHAAPSAGNWLVPLLLLCAVGVLAAFVVFSQPAIQQQVRGARGGVPLGRVLPWTYGIWVLIIVGGFAVGAWATK